VSVRAQASDGDAIRSGYDPSSTTSRRRDAKQYIAGLQARERERTGISSLKVGFNKVFGYYLEITTHTRSCAAITSGAKPCPARTFRHAAQLKG